MRLRVLRPSIDVQPTPEELDQFHQNIVSYADRGKVFAIEVLVEGVCLAGDKPNERIKSSSFFHQISILRKRSRKGSNSTDSFGSPSALSLVYDGQYHKILMKHSDVTMGVTSGLEGNQVANLLRNLVTLCNGVQQATAEWETVKRRDALQISLKQFEKNLSASAQMVPEKYRAEFEAYQKLYRSLTDLSGQVLSRTMLKVEYPENIVHSLPSALGVVAELLKSLNEEDSVNALGSNIQLCKELYKSINAITLPTERLICSMLIKDLWLLEDWNYEREL